MFKKYLYIILFIVAIIGLSYVQYQYFRIGLNLAGTQFNENMGAAAKDIKRELQGKNELTFLVGSAISKNDLSFRLSMDSIQDASIYFMDEFLQDKLLSHGIKTGYGFSLYQKDSAAYLSSKDSFTNEDKLLRYPIILEGYLPDLLGKRLTLELQFENTATVDNQGRLVIEGVGCPQARIEVYEALATEDDRYLGVGYGEGIVYLGTALPDPSGDFALVLEDVGFAMEGPTAVSALAIVDMTPAMAAMTEPTLQFATSEFGPNRAIPSCGDANVDLFEACDDGNNADEDGCSATCTVEKGWSCEGGTSVCSHVCGDGVVAIPAELCDDGNDQSEDGCSETCTPEDGFACMETEGALPESTCTAVCGDAVTLGEEACDDEAGKSDGHLLYDEEGEYGVGFYGWLKQGGVGLEVNVETGSEEEEKEADREAGQESGPECFGGPGIAGAGDHSAIP